MDVQVKYKRYLGVFGTPTDSMCCESMTLRTGYVLVGVMDMLIAVLSMWELAWIMWTSEEVERFTVETLVGDVIAFTAFPFAASGLLGLPNCDLWKVSAYSYFKHCEFLFLCLFYPLVLHDICLEGSLGCDRFTLTLLWVIRFIYNFYTTYLVWSVDMRLKTNQLIIIMHGPRVVESIKSPISPN